MDAKPNTIIQYTLRQMNENQLTGLHYALKVLNYRRTMAEINVVLSNYSGCTLVSSKNNEFMTPS